ncbi:MAG: NUDIX domain-containing protein [Enterocloster bolteae]
MSVWIINNRGEYFFPRDIRTNHIHSAGSVQGGLSGEDSLGGALREVNEELGIILNPKDGQRISRICREQTRDLYDVWVFYKDVDISDITLQETEVVDVKWVTDEELIKMERKGELHPLLALTM